MNEKGFYRVSIRFRRCELLTFLTTSSKYNLINRLTFNYVFASIKISREISILIIKHVLRLNASGSDSPFPELISRRLRYGGGGGEISPRDSNIKSLFVLITTFHITVSKSRSVQPRDTP